MNEINITSNNKCTISEIGLVVHGKLSDTEHKQLWHSLTCAEKGIRWCIGDYLNHCEDVGRGYESLLESTGYEKQTLKNSKVLSRKFPIDKRNTNLTYTHHREAIAESKGNIGLALKALDIADKEQQSVSEMRKSIRWCLAKPSNEPTPRPELESDKVDKVFCEVIRNLQLATTQLNKTKLSTAQYRHILMMVDTITGICEGNE